MNISARSSGFATVTAVSMIALISAMLVLLMAQLRDVRDDARQARLETELRQLLMAGAAASAKLVAEPRETYEIKLPQSLADRGAVTLKTLSANDLEKRIAVEAVLDKRTARQTLRYVKTDYGWGLLEAKLE